MPTKEQAGVYSAVLHYLKAVSAVQNKDPLAVIAKMRESPVFMIFSRRMASCRPDGRMVHDLYLMQVKKPFEIKIPLGLFNDYCHHHRKRRIPPAGSK